VLGSGPTSATPDDVTALPTTSGTCAAAASLASDQFDVSSVNVSQIYGSESDDEFWPGDDDDSPLDASPGSSDPPADLETDKDCV